MLYTKTERANFPLIHNETCRQKNQPFADFFFRSIGPGAAIIATINAISNTTIIASKNTILNSITILLFR